MAALNIKKYLTLSFVIRLFQTPGISVCRHIHKAKTKTALWTNVIFVLFRQYLCFMYNLDKAAFFQD